MFTVHVGYRGTGNAARNLGARYSVQNAKSGTTKSVYKSQNLFFRIAPMLGRVMTATKISALQLFNAYG